ncbi:hypothetical protein [Klebsiella aerogenes]|nr:hypothetical protein [Klebsiella aerogenes]
MKILSTVKYKIALASTALFISASSFAAEGATGVLIMQVRQWMLC